MWLSIIIISITFVNGWTSNKERSCTLLNFFLGEGINLPRYILYDVNQPEGFNLRRDVYMRLAIFIHSSIINKQRNWHLVLPPWTRIYHWKLTDPNTLIPWHTFFDIESLQKFAPVIEMDKFLEAKELQHHVKSLFVMFSVLNMSPSMKFGTNFKTFWLATKKKYKGPYFAQYGIVADNVKCLSFFGQAKQLEEITISTNGRSIMYDHAEIALHDVFGSDVYWECRRSMRFSLPLLQKAAEFRKYYLNSNDESDETIRPKDWRQEKPGRHAVGGPYLCVHMRRQDFVLARPHNIPSLKHAALQIKQILKKLNLDRVFIATDASKIEFKELREYLKEFKVIRYIPTTEEQRLFTDGGIAIIDQIICSHARYFVGSHESTFSFRIEEEREIMGFNVGVATPTV